jgi:hypothetical protein
MVLDPSGESMGQRLDADEWRFQPENPAFREKVLETVYAEGRVKNCWVKRRPIPQEDLWFENVWADYREGKIYH